MSRRQIQVGNLDGSIHDQDLERLFAAHGPVRSAKVATHFESGQSTGVGFVEMESEQAGEAAIAALDGRECAGRVLSVCWSRDRQEPGTESPRMFEPMNMVGEEGPCNPRGPRAGDFGDRSG